MSICRPTKSLIKNIERLENDSSKTFGHRIPVVLSAHPFDFLDDIARRIQDFEHFIVETKEALNAEFFTLDQVRKEYVNRTYSFEFTESKFILSSNDLSILPFIRRLLKHF